MEYLKLFKYINLNRLSLIMLKPFQNIFVFFFGLILFATFNDVQANEPFVNKNLWVYWDK